MQRNKHLKNVFSRFLKDNNAYVEYFSNIKEFNTEGYLKDFFIRNSPESWLRLSFVWSSTMQGCDFWFNLSCKWSQIIHSINTKKEEHYVKSHF